MHLRRSLWTAGAGLVLVASVGGFLLERGTLGLKRRIIADFTVMATPPGVTLTSIGTPSSTDGLTHLRTIKEFLTNGAVVFSDVNGMTYYTSDADTIPGKSTCSDACLKIWPAALAAADAKSFGPWSIIARANGLRQWAYQDKPLYTYGKDQAPGDAQGEAVSGWHTVVFKPASVLTQLIGHSVFKPSAKEDFPFGISIQEVEDAGGQVLIDELGRTLYAFDGDPKDDTPACVKSGSCETSPWIPLPAAALAHGVGHFAIVTRSDGRSQWAYQGWPLYRYVGDVEANQANGVGVDERWRAALLLRYPVPAAVTLRSTLASGRIFTTQDGHPLYREQIFSYNFGHDFQHGAPYYEVLGRVLGTRACTGECTRRWHPFVAPAGARPAGYWHIVNRPDGVRQWVYKGYALYTFVGDKAPGELRGRDEWDISFSDPELHKVSFLNDLHIDAETVSGVFWTTVYP